MAKYDFLKRLPFSQPAVSNAERRALIEAEERAALMAEGAIPSSPEVMGTGSSKFSPNVINIEDADTLSPMLNDANIPLNSIQDKYRKLKQIGAIGAAGTAATLAVNLNDPMASLEPNRMAASIPNEAPIVPAPSEMDGGMSETDKVNERLFAKLSRPTEAEIIKPSAQEIDFGDNTLARQEGLQEAQKSRDLAVLVNQLGKAADIAGSGMSGTQARFGGIFDQNTKNAEGIVTDYQDQVKFEKEDPNSSISKGYRDIAKSMGFNIKGMASASDLERLMPQLANIYNQKEGQYARAQAAKENREAARDMAEMRLAAGKDAKKVDRELKDDAFAQGLRKEATGGNYGKMFSNYNTALRMDDALSQFQANPSGYSDYATLMGGLKTLQGDDSVVREAEIRLGVNATSLANKVKNWSDQLISGRSLQPEQRKEIIKTVRILADASKKQYTNAIEPLLNQAKTRGIDPSKIIDSRIQQQLDAQAPSSNFVAKSGLTPEQRRARILELQSKKGGN